jgi:3'-phosphoadenosine 5'-phosphosulfate sulfotransferase (PAPS reductase)/FAD synthetase
MKHILSFSGGKDSTFLLLELIRRKCQLDEVQFFDTGWEYPVMYQHIEKCKKICEENGIQFVTLHPQYDFDSLFSKYSWCGGCARWGTAYKTQALDKQSQRNKGNIVYIGIAADETERLKKERADFKRFPLAEWGITEAECLKGCYAAGFDWGGMYEHLDRLSCKFCRNKNLKELRNIRKYYHDVWEQLKAYQDRTNLPYKHACKAFPSGLTVQDLERRFELEEQMQAQGLSITSREFHRKLKKLFGAPLTEAEDWEERQVSFFD